jgi:hypothetical protein
MDSVSIDPYDSVNHAFVLSSSNAFSARGRYSSESIPKWRQKAEGSLYDQWAFLTYSEQTAINSIGLPVIWIHAEEPKPFITGLPDVKEAAVHSIVKTTDASPTGLWTTPSVLRAESSEWQRSSENQGGSVAAETHSAIAVPFSEMAPVETRSIETVYLIGDSNARTIAPQAEVILEKEPEEPEDNIEDWKMVKDLVTKYTNVSSLYE